MKFLRRVVCFFRGHRRGRIVMVPPTADELVRAGMAGAIQIMTRPEVWCARCGREYNRHG